MVSPNLQGCLSTATRRGTVPGRRAGLLTPMRRLQMKKTALSTAILSLALAGTAAAAQAADGDRGF
jgi:hypothetical protein